MIWHLAFQSWQGQEHGHNVRNLFGILWLQGNKCQDLQFQVQCQLDWANNPWCLLAWHLPPHPQLPLHWNRNILFPFLSSSTPLSPPPLWSIPSFIYEINELQSETFLISWHFQKLPLKCKNLRRECSRASGKLIFHNFVSLLYSNFLPLYSSWPIRIIENFLLYFS